MIIHGSEVDLTAIGEVKSLADLKKLGINSHLSREEEDAANKELLAALQPAGTDPDK